jgi:methylenetetrahydrofolate reductase (NADPH)
VNSGPMASAAVSTAVLDDFSLEMTGKDVAGLDEAHAVIPAGTRINVTFLGNEDLRMRLDAARAVRRLGFVPVPHISARRLPSADVLGQFLDGLHADGACTDVFVVGGDPSESQGPYPDALSIIRSGLLRTHGVRHVGISGYPEGHPSIPEHELWGSLADKYNELVAQGLSGSIITQFGFDSDAVLAWVQRVRECGIDLPIRVGVPGPVGVRRLMAYAARFGVGTSTSIAKKYGFSLANLMGTAGPDKFLRALAERYAPAVHGEIKVHFYTFGGLKATAEWAARFKEEG